MAFSFSFSSSSSSLQYSLLILYSLLLLSTTLSLAKTTSFRPNSLVIPVTKDTSTKHTQYTTLISQRTPLVPLMLTLDLGGQFLSVDCQAAGQASSTYRRARCGSAACRLAGAKSGCENRTCTTRPHNPITLKTETGQLGSDVVSVGGFTANQVVFACGSGLLLEGLARGSAGIAGLGRNHARLTSQLSAALRSRRRLSLCLPSSPDPTDQGFAAFGRGSRWPPLAYTPLIQNLSSSSEYFIGVRSISVDGNPVPGLNPNNLLSGGAKISTVEPYTVMQTSIFEAVVAAFDRAVPVNFPRVLPVAPFGACYADEGFIGTHPAVPRIDLVLQNEGVVWRIFGPNSMVRVGGGLVCLGFVDGGSSPVTSIVIGGHQIEDNLLQFDLANSRLGFSSTLLLRKTSCTDFNFMSNQ